MIKNTDSKLRNKLARVREMEGQAKDHCDELYRRPGHRRRMEIVISLLKKLIPGRSFLEIGCAEGLYCNIAYELGAAHIVGIDISPTKIANAMTRYPECEFICGDIFELHDMKGQFDIVLCGEVLQHVLDYQLAAKCIFDCLKAGGSAIITAPNLSKSQDHLFATISSDMTIEQLLNEIGGAGFGKQNALWKFNTEKLFNEIVNLDKISLVEKIPVDTPDGRQQNLWTVGVFKIDR